MKKLKRLAFLVCLVTLASVAALAQGSGGAKGKVRNTKGAALAGVEVTARLDGKDVKTVKTDSKGAFAIDGLTAGTYNFAFEKEGYQLGIKFGVKISSGETTDLGGNLALAPDQSSQVVVTGSVFNQVGRTVTGAKIEVERVGEDGSTKRITTTYSNSMGEFSFRQPDGNYTFRVTASLKGVKATKELTTRGAAIYRMAVTLVFPVEGEEKE